MQIPEAFGTEGLFVNVRCVKNDELDKKTKIISRFKIVPLRLKWIKCEILIQGETNQIKYH